MLLNFILVFAEAFHILRSVLFTLVRNNPKYFSDNGIKRNPSFYLVYAFRLSYKSSIKIIKLWDYKFHQILKSKLLRFLTRPIN